MDAHWRKTTPGESKIANQPLREQRIDGIVKRQLWLITSRQLFGVGFSETAIQKRSARGSLHRLHAGVYATHPPPYSREQRWLAAVLACGPGAALSDLCSAALQGIVTTPPLTAQVTVPSGRGRTRRGITVHRRASIDPRDLRRFKRVPCTSADLTLVHLAPSHTAQELETIMVAAASLGFLKRARLAELVAERRGRPGIHKLERLLQLEPALTRSELELLFFPIWQAAGVERPRVNLPIDVPGRDRPLTVDFAWPEIRLVVEADSQRFHGDWQQAEIDRERDQLLALAGWVSHRFVRRRIKDDPAGSAERLRQLTAVRIAELG